ncbi:MAG: hypothetical protein ACRYFW_00140 [Janthinobacterium lividum]
MVLLALLLASQAQPLICSGTVDERNCRSEDGSTYVERRLVDQIVRQGTLPDGTSWTEYLTRMLDGERLEGSDTRGRHWVEQCNPRFGTTGTDRNGKSIYIPPPPRVPKAEEGKATGHFDAVSNPIGSDRPPANACSNL